MDWRTKDSELHTEEQFRERIAAIQRRIEEPEPIQYEARRKREARDAKLVDRREALSLRLAMKLRGK